MKDKLIPLGLNELLGSALRKLAAYCRLLVALLIYAFAEKESQV